MAKARKAATRSGTSRGRKKAATLSVGPIVRAMDRFERAARKLSPQPAAIAKALAAVAKARKALPLCAADQDDDSNFVPLA